MLDIVVGSPALQLMGITMRARRILQTGAFHPDDVNRLQRAFDSAWEQIAPHIPELQHPESRDQLATVVVSAGNVSGLDASELSETAVRTFNAIRKGQSALQ